MNTERLESIEIKMGCFSASIKPNQPSSIGRVLLLAGLISGPSSPSLAAVETLAPLPGSTATYKTSSLSANHPASAPGGSAKPLSKPGWQDLTPAQQLSLKPLAANWSGLSQGQKRKWIAISAGYAKLSPTEQATMHSRMTEWAGLSQSQRAQARLNFADTKQVDTSQKAANWQAYQALSAEEKKKLGITAPHIPAGAAATAKPVHPQRLATVPVNRLNLTQGPKMAAANHPVDPNTLLPVTDPVAAPKD